MTDNPAPVRVAIALVHHLGVADRPPPRACAGRGTGVSRRQGEARRNAAAGRRAHECREETGLHVAADETLGWFAIVIRTAKSNCTSSCRCDGAAARPGGVSPGNGLRRIVFRITNSPPPTRRFTAVDSRGREPGSMSADRTPPSDRNSPDFDRLQAIALHAAGGELAAVGGVDQALHVESRRRQRHRGRPPLIGCWRPPFPIDA